MKRKKVLCFAALAVAVWAMGGWHAGATASDENAVDASARRIGDVHVVASPIIEGNVLDRYAGQKTTVTAEQIENLNALDISTALRKTPGVTISRYNPVGAFGGGEGGAVFIRGMGASRPGAEIKTFVDGVPMYMSIWNHPLLDLLAIDPAGSIDVYKGPQPQHFGNAVAAMNIVPKRKTDPGFASKIKLAAGSYGTMVASAETAGKTDRWDYFTGGGFRASDGHRDHGSGMTRNVFGRFGYRMSDHWSASFFGLYANNTADDPGVKGGNPADRQGTYETRAFLTSLKLSHEFDRLSGFVQLYRNAGEGNWLDQPTAAPGVFENLFNDFAYAGFKIKETAAFSSGWEVTGGLDWEYTEGDYKKHFTDGTTDHWPGHDFTLVMPYAAASWEIGDADGLYAVLSGGFRYYANSDFDPAWSPHAGMVAGYRSLEGHLGYSRGVIYPGLDVVVFSEEVIPFLGDSWEELEPEIMDHYEAGLSYKFGRTAVLEATFFYNDGKDRYVVIPPPPPPPVYDNVEDYVTKGLEASVQVCPSAEFSLFVSGTFIRTDPSDLPYAPDKTFSTGLSWRFLPKWTLNLDAQYVDDMTVASQARRSGATNRQTVEDYFIVNGKLSYAFNLNRDRLSGEVFAAGENLTDADYAYKPGYPMPGFNAMGGMSVFF